MNFRQVLPALLFCLSLTGCSDQTTIFDEPLRDQLVPETRAAVLAGAVRFDTAGVLEIYEDPSNTGKAADVAGDFPLNLIASVAPPSYAAGDQLTASHVDLDGDYAYVGYNTVGEEFYGAIDVVDISDPHNPRVSGRMFYLEADINALKYDQGYLYIVGGVNAETSVEATSNSFVAQIPVQDGQLVTAGIRYGFQQGNNATDVLTLDDRILVSSGKEGSVTAYSKADMSIMGEVYVADARALARTETGFAVLDAGTGVRLMQTDFTETGLVPIATDLGLATKRTLDFRDGRILVAEAQKGAGVYDAASGNLLEYLDIPIHPDGADTADIVTNAVVANADALFMANGGAGFSLTQWGGAASRLVGIIELEGSVNYAASRDDYVFAATGQGGLQVIRLLRPVESLAGSCEALPLYEGSSNLVVNPGENLAYRGSKRFQSMDIAGSALLCGAWTVFNHVDIQAGGTFEWYGSLAVGRFFRRRNITVGEGAVLRIEGDLTLYGDLILNDGATLEILGGQDSVLDIFGQVITNGEVTINGTFRDVRRRF
ncbi:hypothetical protein OZ410_11140 [Robiginitalea sp. M366]|uniref:hypothetical protein n=1 Tax=Robiginitalea aestuariiviva TaxID=3036903 RepID=UPI00240D5BDB|nr:hypothetical protein [Robiginitalea aestuariiviva]MDG1572871.1 hypothetical protein [Robiginitalea aestuariiviva]